MIRRLNTYDRALINIKENLLKLSKLVERRLSVSIHSFCEQDIQSAQTIIDEDEEIDTLDENLEMKSLELISIQQPLERDLRFLASVMRISRELERIGDYACDIAEAISELKEMVPYFKPLVDLTRLAEIVQTMMHKSLKAYMEKDVSKARELDDDDDEVDRLFLSLLRELNGYMKKDPEYVDQASAILLVTRYLERIGDHIVNIAEMCIFMETGERHPFKKNNKAGD